MIIVFGPESNVGVITPAVATAGVTFVVGSTGHTVSNVSAAAVITVAFTTGVASASKFLFLPLLLLPLGATATVATAAGATATA